MRLRCQHPTPHTQTASHRPPLSGFTSFAESPEAQYRTMSSHISKVLQRDSPNSSASVAASSHLSISPRLARLFLDLPTNRFTSPHTAPLLCRKTLNESVVAKHWCEWRRLEGCEMCAHCKPRRMFLAYHAHVPSDGHRPRSHLLPKRRVQPPRKGSRNQSTSQFVRNLPHPRARCIMKAGALQQLNPLYMYGHPRPRLQSVLL